MGARLMASLRLMGRMDYGCHRARVSIILTGEQNVSRTGFNTMKRTRIALTLTPLCQSIGIGVACSGSELRMRGLTFSVSVKNSSSTIGIDPPPPIDFYPAGTRGFIRMQIVF